MHLRASQASVLAGEEWGASFQVRKYLLVAPGPGQEGIRLVSVGIGGMLPFPGGDGAVLLQERYPALRQLPVGVGGFSL